MSKMKTFTHKGAFKEKNEDGIGNFNTSANDIVNPDTLPKEPLEKGAMNQNQLEKQPLLRELHRRNSLHRERTRQRLQSLDTLRRDQPWLRNTTEIFLDECIKRKTVLRKPRMRRCTIFGQIRLGMLENGFDFDEQALDRKFRNLKTHFFYVKNNNDKKRANLILWPYYEKMNEIFPAEVIRDTRAESSLRNKPSSLSTISSRIPQNLKKFCVSSKRKEERPHKMHYTNKLENLRNELIAFEERRTVAIEAIAIQLMEANKLSREKLEVEKKRMEQRNTYQDENVDE